MRSESGSGRREDHAVKIVHGKMFRIHFCVEGECFNKTDICPAQFKDKGKHEFWFCSRDKGHQGPHIACSVDTHNHVAWGDKASFQGVGLK